MDVQNLAAVADGQHGFVSGHGVIQDGAISAVAIGVECFCVRVARLAVADGIYVGGAAGQNKSIEGRGLLLQLGFGQGQRNVLGFATGAADRVKIEIELFDAALTLFIEGAPRNPNARFAMHCRGYPIEEIESSKIVTFAPKGGNDAWCTNPKFNSSAAKAARETEPLCRT